MGTARGVGWCHESLTRWCCHKVVPGAAESKAAPAWQHQLGRCHLPDKLGNQGDKASTGVFYLCQTELRWKKPCGIVVMQS